jgi:hypothetical protein
VLRPEQDVSADDRVEDRGAESAGEAKAAGAVKVDPAVGIDLVLCALARVMMSLPCSMMSAIRSRRTLTMSRRLPTVVASEVAGA